MHDSKRSYIYWDGSEIAALAALYADPSLNWFDPHQLETAKLDGALSHIWFAPQPCSSTREGQAQKTLHRLLKARGVDIRIVDQLGPDHECSRCGHASRDETGATSLALTLDLLSDAAQDLFDCAFVVTNQITQVLLAKHKALLPAGKRIVTLQLDLVALEAARLPRLVDCGGPTKLQRPSIWNRPRWMSLPHESFLTESGV